MEMTKFGKNGHTKRNMPTAYTKEHRDALAEESPDNSIEKMLRLPEVYISGKGELI